MLAWCNIVFIGRTDPYCLVGALTLKYDFSKRFMLISALKAALTALALNQEQV